MDNRPNEITFITDDNEEVIFQVIEQTRLGGVNYLLVSITDGDEEEALILKDVSKDEDEEAIYSIVDDDMEIAMASEIFSELIDDIELY
jgi:thiamine monophosphate synthase